MMWTICGPPAAFVSQVAVDNAHHISNLRTVGEFSVRVSVVVRGVAYDLPEEYHQLLLDFERTRGPWSVLRPSRRAERKRIQAELDAWVRTQSEAGLGRPATSTDFEQLARSRRLRHDDPTVDAALERLGNLLDELQLRQTSLGVDEGGVIQVKIRPFRARHVRRIKETCGTASVEIARVPRG
jgi:hypothetical protein